mmetsp:Transcript_27663/g.65875  ORF Transcript_27663/g.65875 Transcript_27663/m.65875 type:complete len:222 (+) Transcript_27663:788-1453(+)
MMAAIILTVSTGHTPLAVSPESITQSVPWHTALATSVTSARVGRGLTTIDSSIWVAVMTGLPAMLHLRMIIFCARYTSWMGISMPRSPRATMIPSEISRISSKFSMPSSDSILEKIMMLRPGSPSTFLMVRTSSALRTNEAAIRSTPCWTPNMRSDLSFSVIDGRSTAVPGRLIPFVSPRVTVFSTMQTTSVPSMRSTLRPRSPSSIATFLPTVSTVERLA